MPTNPRTPLIPRLLIALTGRRREPVSPDFGWGNGSALYKAFRLWEFICWRRCGSNRPGDNIRIESSFAYVPNEYYKIEFYTIEGALVHLEAQIKQFFRSLLDFKLRLPKIYIVPAPVLITPAGQRIHHTPYRFAIAFDSNDVGNVNTTPGTSDTLAHTVTGSNPLLWFYVAIRDNDLLSGITFNSVSASISDATNGKTVWNNAVNAFLYLYYLAGQTGTHNMVFSYSSAPGTRTEYTGTSFSGCAQTGIPDASAKTADNGGSGFTQSLTSSKDNCWTTMAFATNGSSAAGAGTTIRTNLGGAGAELSCDSNGAIHPAGSTSLTITVGSASHAAGVMASFAPFVASTFTPRRMLMGVGK